MKPPYPLVVVGHGTRDPEGVLEFQTLMTQMAAVHSGIIESGFLEIQQPSIHEAIDCAIRRAEGEQNRLGVVVLPAQLLGARHVQNDIPNAVNAARSRHPTLSIHLGQSLKRHDKIMELCRMRCEEALSALPVIHRKETALLVVGRGTSDPLNHTVSQLAQTLNAQLGCGGGIGCSAGLSPPFLADAFSLGQAQSARRFLVLPFFLFMGKMVRTVQEEIQKWRAAHQDCPVDVARHIGPDAQLRDALLDRYAEVVRAL